MTIVTVVVFFICEGSVTTTGLTSFRGDAESLTEGDAGGGGETRVSGRGSGKAPGAATSFSSLRVISGRALFSSVVVCGGAGASAAEGDVPVAARVDGVGLDSAAAAGVAVAIASVGNGGTGEDFLAAWGDDDDTLVLLDEIDNDRDLGRAAARAPARLFGGCAAEGGLVTGERGVRGVLREFLRTLGERSRPITGRAGVAPPPSVAVVISGRGRSLAVEEGVFARFLGNGRGGFSFSRAPLMSGRRMVVVGDLVLLFGDFNAFKRAAEGMGVERGVLAVILDLIGAGVLWGSGLSFGLRVGMGMREGGESLLEVGLTWYRGGGSRVASGVLQMPWLSKRVLIGDLEGREAERGPTMAW